MVVWACSKIILSETWRFLRLAVPQHHTTTRKYVRNVGWKWEIRGERQKSSRPKNANFWGHLRGDIIIYRYIIYFFMLYMHRHIFRCDKVKWWCELSKTPRMCHLLRWMINKLNDNIQQLEGYEIDISIYLFCK